MKGREVPMPYWRLPERLYDEPDEVILWATAAFDAAKRATAEKANGKVTRKPPKPVAPKEKTTPARRRTLTKRA